MKNVIIAEKRSITTSTGDVELDRCDAGEIHIQTSTGDVQGSLLTTKDFHADSNTGDVKVPSSSEGGKCEITCSTGDIHITVVSNWPIMDKTKKQAVWACFFSFLLDLVVAAVRDEVQVVADTL